MLVYSCDTGPLGYECAQSLVAFIQSEESVPITLSIKHIELAIS